LFHAFINILYITFNPNAHTRANLNTNNSTGGVEVIVE
jgi:hypothetical protein